MITMDSFLFVIHEYKSWGPKSFVGPVSMFSIGYAQNDDPEWRWLCLEMASELEELIQLFMENLPAENRDFFAMLKEKFPSVAASTSQQRPRWHHGAIRSLAAGGELEPKGSPPRHLWPGLVLRS